MREIGRIEVQLIVRIIFANLMRHVHEVLVLGARNHRIRCVWVLVLWRVVAPLVRGDGDVADLNPSFLALLVLPLANSIEVCLVFDSFWVLFSTRIVSLEPFWIASLLRVRVWVMALVDLYVLLHVDASFLRVSRGLVALLAAHVALVLAWIYEAVLAVRLRPLVVVLAAHRQLAVLLFLRALRLSVVCPIVRVDRRVLGRGVGGFFLRRGVVVTWIVGF
jgi:hypothetical protein